MGAGSRAPSPGSGNWCARRRSSTGAGPPADALSSPRSYMSVRGADSPRLAAEPGQLGANLLRAGMTQVVEDGKRLPPGLAGSRQLAGRLAAVTEVAEGIRFVIAVAKLPEEAQRTLVAGDGLAEFAILMLGEAEAVPGACLGVTVTECGAQGE